MGVDEARAAAVEEESLRDDVGCVQGADAEGDDGVEGGGGADVDETDEDGDEGGDDDGEGWDGGFGLELDSYVNPLITLQLLLLFSRGAKMGRK